MSEADTWQQAVDARDAECAWQADVRGYVNGGNERVAREELTDASSEADVFSEIMR